MLRNDFNAIQWLPTSAGKIQLPKFIEMGIPHGFHGINSIVKGVITPRQVHGVDIVKVSAVTSLPGDADGIYCVNENISIAVKTADCLPILIGVPGKIVLAIHAGWRGLTAGIVQNAAEKILALGFNTKDALIGIGPTIGSRAFEVGPEVVDAVATPQLGLAENEIASCIAKGINDRWHIDLQLVALLILVKCGAKPSNISVVRTCTYHDTNWNSFRRMGKSMGSNIAWIGIARSGVK